MALWGVAFLGTRPFSAAIDGGIAELTSSRTAGVAMGTAAFVAALIQGRAAERPVAPRPAELAGTEY